MAYRHYGRVTWYDVDKGYGFIRPESGDDVVVRARDLADPDISLQAGQRVTFSISHAHATAEAHRVRIL
jgi:CspA family cold shock protein